MALGTDVGGYVMPMFHSQTALAYFPELVSDPPGTYDELRAWVEAHPKQFGYNGIKNGMSGVAFVVGWIYTYGGNTDQVINGPYDPALKDTWDAPSPTSRRSTSTSPSPPATPGPSTC